MCGDKVIRVFNQFVLGDRINQARDGAGAEEGQRQAADTLDERMSPLQ